MKNMGGCRATGSFVLHDVLNALEFWYGSSLPVTSVIKTEVALVLSSMMNAAEFFG